MGIEVTARQRQEDYWLILGAAVLFGEALEGRMAVMEEEGRAVGELVRSFEEARRQDRWPSERVATQHAALGAMWLAEAEGRERRLLRGLEADLRAAHEALWATARPCGAPSVHDGGMLAISSQN